ncbi:chloride channel protein [Streptomyces sp. CA-135486]|uniref:chloride channel protein n=1 Tax=Streptomyces sp. CA-135486 TaxID=3240049 RepID=UPI003D94C819
MPPFHADHINQYCSSRRWAWSPAWSAPDSRTLPIWSRTCATGPGAARNGCARFVGGVPLSLVLLVLPEMYGTGYPVLEKAAEGGYPTGFLLLLLAGKVLATSLTLGVGGAGGMFAPTLFVGTTLGAAYGTALNQLLPSTAGAVASYALVGMGTVFTATSGTPLTAAALLFELTGQFSIVPPLAAGIALALLTARLLSRGTIYTLKLRR